MAAGKLEKIRECRFPKINQVNSAHLYARAREESQADKLFSI
jgi:hypothetical protein